MQRLVSQQGFCQLRFLAFQSSRQFGMHLCVYVVCIVEAFVEYNRNNFFRSDSSMNFPLKMTSSSRKYCLDKSFYLYHRVDKLQLKIYQFKLFISENKIFVSLDITRFLSFHYNALCISIMILDTSHLRSILKLHISFRISFIRAFMKY